MINGFTIKKVISWFINNESATKLGLGVKNQDLGKMINLPLLVGWVATKPTMESELIESKVWLNAEKVQTISSL